ncbi:MAG: NAD(P)H-dependent oxidoreductase [Bacteroidota bacterium]
MKSILVFGASNSKESINKKLAVWSANQLEHVNIDLVDLKDYEMAIYGIDLENEIGIPDQAKKFKEKVHAADGILVSFAEHNGGYTAVFKNLFDWISRIESPIWANKPMFLMATSPGGRGAKSVLNLVTTTFPHRGGDIVASFSLPFFEKKFSEVNGITDETLLAEFKKQLKAFEKAL